MFQPKPSTIEVNQQIIESLKQKSAYLQKQAENTNVTMLQGAIYHAAGYLDGIALLFEFEMQKLKSPNCLVQRKGGE